jgi:Sigma-70 region 2
VCRYGKLVSTTVRSFRLQEADTLDAVQTTWLRLAENAHQMQFPEKLGGWLATTARRECLHILRQAKPSPNLPNMTPETVAEPSVGPEQRAVDADTARTLWNLVAEFVAPPEDPAASVVHQQFPLLRRGRPHDGNPARRDRTYSCASLATAARQIQRTPAGIVSLTMTAAVTA